jgi:SAM-dependent methyltransferase
MTGFSADWLRLREPFDRQARERAAPALGLAAHAARWRRGAAEAPLAVMDLACGSGANLRELAPRLGGPQHWCLVDHDPALLAAVPHALAEWGRQPGHRFGSRGDTLHIRGPGFSAEVTRRTTDLARDLATLDFAPVHLVTASALLDLVSEPWLQQLAQQGRSAGTALLFALNVDGRTQWQPADPHDDAVHREFSLHQRRDKGFGPALGPQAVPRALQVLAGAGYQVTQALSDWVIDATVAPAAGGDAAAMLAAMVDGMAAAAIEQAPGSAPGVRAWQARRQAALAATRLVVGHADLIATC